MALIKPDPNSVLTPSALAVRCSTGASLSWRDITEASTRIRAVCTNAPYEVVKVPGFTNQRILDAFLQQEFQGRFSLSKETLTGFVSDSPRLEEPARLEWSHRTSRPFKAFKEAQQSGHIIVSPMSVGRFQVNDLPRVVGTMDGAIRSGQFSFRSGIIASDVLGCRTPGAFRFPEWEDDVVTTYGSRDPEVPCTFQYYPNAGLASLFLEDGPPDLALFKAYLDNLTIPVNLHNAALSELHDGLYDIATDLLELPETIKWSYSLLRRILNAFMAFRRNELKIRKGLGSNVVETSKELAAAWMEFRYAITPVVKSLEDIVRYRLTAPRAYVTVRKRSDLPITVKAGNYTFEANVERRVFAKGRFDVNSSYAGLGLNPLKALYEVTPWTFMVSWVFPFGELLGTMAPPTNTTQRVLTHSWMVRNVSVTHSQHGKLESSMSYYRTAVRSPTTQWGISPDVNINWKRKLDALALGWLMSTTALEIK